jgi:hypothetical protein
MISIRHPNAQELFDRDMACLKRFFESKLKCHMEEEEEDADESCHWERIMEKRRNHVGEEEDRLDEKLRASGISLHDNQQLELYYFESGLKPIASAVLLEEDNEDEDDDDEPSSSSGSEHEDDPAINNNDDNNKERHDHSDVMIVDTSAADASWNGRNGADNHDGSTIASATLSIRTLTREELQVIAKDRVQKQIDDQKRKARMRGAYRKQNTNKSYQKGKRVIAESLC